jgi:branched-chain amino acid aminotransferase
MALFESFPVLNGSPILLAEHLSRLKMSCVQAGFHLDFYAFDKIPELLHSIAFDAFVRVYITAGDGGPTSAATDCRIFIMAESREPLPESAVENGYRLAIHPDAHHPMFGGMKTANYWMNIHARQLAMERQNHEALLLNSKGELISACMANVFVAINGVLRTPSLKSGARDGVLRKWVLNRAEAQEGPILSQDIRNADEIFLTSSGIGVMSASTVEGRPLASRKFATPLRNEYEAYIAALSRKVCD